MIECSMLMIWIYAKYGIDLDSHFVPEPYVLSTCQLYDRFYTLSLDQLISRSIINLSR